MYTATTADVEFGEACLVSIKQTDYSCILDATDL